MKKLILTSVCAIVLVTANAQIIKNEVISTSGDGYKNTVYQLDWSVGEITTETFSNSQNIITQGFHQNTYEITTIDEMPFSAFSILAFPNPTSNFISLKIDSDKFESFNYFVTDLAGRALQNGKFFSQTEQIDFSNYSCGTYIITVLNSNKTFKTFQIVKN